MLFRSAAVEEAPEERQAHRLPRAQGYLDDAEPGVERQQHEESREEPVGRLDIGQSIDNHVEGKEEEEALRIGQARHRIRRAERGEQSRRGERQDRPGQRKRRRGAYSWIPEPPKPEERQEKEGRFGQRNRERQPDQEEAEDPPVDGTRPANRRFDPGRPGAA